MRGAHYRRTAVPVSYQAAIFFLALAVFGIGIAIFTLEVSDQ